LIKAGADFIGIENAIPILYGPSPGADSYV